MREVTIDIETVPTQDPVVQDHLRERLERENASKQERYHKTFDDVWRQTSLDVVVAEPISIAIQIDDDPIEVFMRTELGLGTEILLLDDVFDYLRRELTSHTIIKGQEVVAPSKWIGYNIKDFDLRILFNRCRVHQYDPRVRFHLDNSAQMCDIMRELGGYSSKNMVPLDRAAAAFGAGEKTVGMHGSKVWETFLERDFRRIAMYNMGDVDMCRKIYKKMFNLQANPAILMQARMLHNNALTRFNANDFITYDSDDLSL